jgi:DNA-directed RNA polymerase specialized sigma54-like protein
MKKRAFKKIRQSNSEKQKQIITIVVLSLALLPSPVFAVTQTAEVLPAPDLTVSPADISLAPEKTPKNEVS